MGVGYESLSVDEIRGLLRLVHELHLVPAGGTGRRERMLAGLCGLAGASAGESTILRVDGGEVRVLSSVRHGTIGHGRREGLMVRQAGGREVVDPALGKLLRGRRGTSDAVVSRARGDVVGNREWYGSPFVGEVRRGLGADEAVYSVRPMGAGVFAVICLAGEDEPLGGRAVSIVQLLHSEAGWVYGGEDGRDDGGRGDGDGGSGGGPGVRIGLSPRQRECLGFLLRGKSEKQIAADLGVSRHTVHVHVKAVYKAARVSTRAELMARFMAPKGRRAQAVAAARSGL